MDQKKSIKPKVGASLVVQWLRISLAMHGTWVHSPVLKILHATEQLSLCTTTTELAL